MKYRTPSIIAGLLATAALLGFYSVVMRLLAGSWDAAWSQFVSLWYYMVPLSVGFGIQVGLYIRLRRLIKGSTGKHIMTSNTTTSTIGMIACCAHHLTDILPFIGLTVLSTFFVTFQKEILLIGIISNGIGSLLLAKQLRHLQSS